MYETPDVGKLNSGDSTPQGINDYVWTHTVAVGEAYVAAMIAGVFFQVIFQFDTTYPLATPPANQ